MLRIFIGTELIFKGSIKRKLYQHSNIRYPVPIPNTNSTYNNFKFEKDKLFYGLHKKELQILNIYNFIK